MTALLKLETSRVWNWPKIFPLLDDQSNSPSSLRMVISMMLVLPSFTSPLPWPMYILIPSTVQIFSLHSCWVKKKNKNKCVKLDFRDLAASSAWGRTPRPAPTGCRPQSSPRSASNIIIIVINVIDIDVIIGIDIVHNRHPDLQATSSSSTSTSSTSTSTSSSA